MASEHDSLSTRGRPPAGQAIREAIAEAVASAGGWLPFDRYMALALNAPGLAYYARGQRIVGELPEDGSDYATAPEMSPLFARALAVQVRQALDATHTGEVWEFGAGSGVLAAPLIEALGPALRRYHVVELSGTLQARQRERLAAFGDRVAWHATLPEQLQGVIVGNEVLDALPVKLLHWDGRQWHERGVEARREAGGIVFAWADRATALRPPVDAGAHPGFVPGTVTEIHPQAEALVRTLALALQRGAMFFIDYGFPDSEYYHPQRTGGTLMCHRGHRADADPLADAGEKDITAHLNFSAIALAGQDSGLDVIGYTSQARFLMNCGMLEGLQHADLRSRTAAHRLLAEHEMGELFKVIAFARGATFSPVGFAVGDRTHRL